MIFNFTKSQFRDFYNKFVKGVKSEVPKITGPTGRIIELRRETKDTISLRRIIVKFIHGILEEQKIYERKN